MPSNHVQGTLIHRSRQDIHIPKRASEQEKRWSYGCKDELIVTNDTWRMQDQNLSSAWIDYKIAFDSVPHSLIVKYKEIDKICHGVTQLITETNEHLEVDVDPHSHRRITDIKSY